MTQRKLLYYPNTNTYLEEKNLKKLEDLSLRFDSERENWHEEREQYIKEIAMIRLEERNFFINEIDKIFVLKTY